MKRFNDILRLHYLFSVIMPMLIAIYINNLNVLHHFDIFIGFAMLGITGNTWNDYVDMRDPTEINTRERTKEWHPYDILALGFFTLIIGLFLLIRTIIEHTLNALYLLLIILFVIFYIKIFKPIPIINHFLLGFSHIIFPYLMILTDAGVDICWTNIIVMIGLLMFGAAGQFMHEIIDGDSITHKMNKDGYITLVRVAGIISSIYGVYMLYILNDIYMIILPIAPLAVVFVFRNPDKIPKNLKDLGLIAGNVFMVFIITLIIMKSI